MKRLIPALALVFFGGAFVSLRKVSPSVAPAPRALSMHAPAIARPTVAPRARAEAVGPAATTTVDSLATALTVADQFVEAHRVDWDLQAYHRLTPQGVEMPGGHYRVLYKISQGNVPIVGMEILLDVTVDGSVSVFSNTYRPVEAVETSPRLTPDQALELNAERFAKAGTESSGKPILYALPNSDTPELAYSLAVVAQGASPYPLTAVVRASDGQVLSTTSPRVEFGGHIARHPTQGLTF